MTSTVTPATTGGPARQPPAGDGLLTGRVTFVADRLSPPPAWLGDFGLAAPSRSQLVRMSLPSDDAAGSPQLRDGDGCRARIVLGSEPPLSLLSASGIN